MLKSNHLNWKPDLRLPAGSGTNLQAFISHDKETELRVNDETLPDRPPRYFPTKGPPTPAARRSG